MRGRGGGGQQVGSWGAAPEFFPEQSSFGRPQGQGGRPWDSRLMLRQGGGGGGGMPVPMNGGHHGPPSAFGDHGHGSLPNGVDRKGPGDSAHDQRMGAERKEGAHLRHSQSEADTKRAKQ